MASAIVAARSLDPFGDVFVTAWLKYREQTSD
jgi:hypothetical protein